MGRGFLRGVIWGVVVAASTLVLLSQIGPPPGAGRQAATGPEPAPMPEVLPDAADATGNAPAQPGSVGTETVAGTAPVMQQDGAAPPAAAPPQPAAPAQVADPGPETVAAPLVEVPPEAPPLADASPVQEPVSAPDVVAGAPDTVPGRAEAEAAPAPPAPAEELVSAPDVAAAQESRTAPMVLAVAPEAAAPPAAATGAVAPERPAPTRPAAASPAAPDAPPPGDAGPDAAAAAPGIPDAALLAPRVAAATPPASAAPALPAPEGASDRPPAPPRPAPIVLAEVAPPAADGPPPPPLTPEEAALAATAPGAPEAPPLVIVEAEEPALPGLPSVATPEELPASVVVPALPPPEPAPPGAAAPAEPPAVLARSEPLPSAAGLDAEVPGVTIGRLPRIGTAAPAAQAGAQASAQAADLPPLQRHARPFDNPAAKPAFAVVLIDSGDPTLDRAALAALPFPVTFALDPTAPGAELAATIYRAAGQEVAMLATGIPEGATAADLEQTFAAHAAALPEAVAVMDPEAGGFQGDRALAAQVVPIVKGYGRGVLSWDRGLNAASQVARREGVANGVIFRRLDGEDEGAAIIRRYLDRAAFKAVQDGRVIVAGETRPETVAALLAWAVEGRAATVALAPLSAALAAE